MPYHLLENPPPYGVEIIFERETDRVLFKGVRQLDDTWQMALDGEDTTFDPTTISRWFPTS